jgi:hypothetical protein
MSELEYRKIGVELLGLSGEKLELFISEQIFQDRNLKTGDSVIYLHYYSFVTPDDVVEELKKAIEASSLELSYRDEINSMKASALEVLTHLMITRSIASWIFENVAWKAIEHYFMKALVCSSEAILRKHGGASDRDKRAIHQISFRLERGVLEFNVPIDADPKLVKQCLKKLPKIAKVYLKHQSNALIYHQWKPNDQGSWEQDGNTSTNEEPSLDID